MEIRLTEKVIPDQSEVEKVAKIFFKMLEGYEFQDKPNKVPTHGSCCTCQDCGYHFDDCICSKRDTFESCKGIALLHIREKAIAVLEAKIQAIDDLKGKTNYSAKDNDEYVVRWSEFDKEIKKLQSRLAEMRNNE